MPTESEDAVMELREELAQAIHIGGGAPEHHVNSTDATRGQPLVQRARQRQKELESILESLDEHDLRARTDIETALSVVDSLLTGDTDHIDQVTAIDLNRWLEHNKHLAEKA